MEAGSCFELQQTDTWLTFTPGPPAPLGLLSVLPCLRGPHTQDEGPSDGETMRVKGLREAVQIQPTLG